MMTYNLWRAEWLKTRKFPINRVMFVGMLLIITISYVIVTILALTNPTEFLEGAHHNLSFPYSLRAPATILQNLAQILAVVFIANSVGSEYGRDTWKMILPRYKSSVAFLIAKCCALVLAGVILTIVFLLTATIVGLLGALITGIDPIVQDPGDIVTSALVSIGLGAVSAIFYGAITFLATIVARSTIGGVMISIVLASLGPLLSIAVAQISQTVALALPFLHMQNINASWGSSGNENFATIAQILGQPVEPTTSLLIIGAWIVGCLAISFWLFARRDMAG